MALVYAWARVVVLTPGQFLPSLALASYASSYPRSALTWGKNSKRLKRYVLVEHMDYVKFAHVLTYK